MRLIPDGDAFIPGASAMPLTCPMPIRFLSRNLRAAGAAGASLLATAARLLPTGASLLPTAASVFAAATLLLATGAASPAHAAKVTECAKVGICYCVNDELKPTIASRVDKFRALLAD